MENQFRNEENKPQKSEDKEGTKNNFSKQINLKANEVYKNLMPVVPSRNHLFVYIITALVSLFVFVLISVLLVLSSNFSSNFIAFYVIIAAVSIVFGAVTGLIIEKLVREEKLILCGSLSISIIGAFCIFVLILMLKKVNSNMGNFSESSGIGITSMFGVPPNPWITMCLMIILFNVFPYIIMYKRKKKINLQKE